MCEKSDLYLKQEQVLKEVREVKPVQGNTMCCCLFWIVYSRHLAVPVCELMGVQSIWLFSPCHPFSANPPLICMDPSVSAERRALKTERQKFPRQPLQIILFSVIILKRGTQTYKQKVLVLFIFLQMTQEAPFVLPLQRVS